MLTKKRVSFPVGRVDYLTLRPFTFVEYLNAKGLTDWADTVSIRMVSYIPGRAKLRHPFSGPWYI